MDTCKAAQMFQDGETRLVPFETPCCTFARLSSDVLYRHVGRRVHHHIILVVRFSNVSQTEERTALNCRSSSLLVDVPVLSREQLGGNKYLLTDGLFVAKVLDRTLVEYPAKDSRYPFHSISRLPVPLLFRMLQALCTSLCHRLNLIGFLSMSRILFRVLLIAG